MSKFSLKSIFVKDDEQNQNDIESNKKNDLNSFPEDKINQQFPNKTFSKVNTVSISDGILNQVLEVYEKGFDSLNKPGYDFYEFFKSLHSVNDFSSGAYKMAFQMGKTMNNTLDKNFLLLSADGYLLEISKVYENYRKQGEEKKQALLTSQSHEQKALSNEISNLENQIANLKNQIIVLENTKRQKEEQISPIESKYQTELKLIEEKLLANGKAKEIIMDKINSVKSGLINNIQ